MSRINFIMTFHNYLPSCVSLVFKPGLSDSGVILEIFLGCILVCSLLARLCMVTHGNPPTLFRRSGFVQIMWSGVEYIKNVPCIQERAFGTALQTPSPNPCRSIFRQIQIKKEPLAFRFLCLDLLACKPSVQSSCRLDIFGIP